MAHIEGRKLEVTLPGGRIVSHQRAAQIINKDNKYYLQKRKYLTSDEGRKIHNAIAMKSWNKMKLLRNREV